MAKLIERLQGGISSIFGKLHEKKKEKCLRNLILNEIRKKNETFCSSESRMLLDRA